MGGALFEDCDFRGACFSHANLRGTSFLRCKLAGAHGQPRATEGMVLTDCDLSREELLRQLPRSFTVDELAARATSVLVAADRAASAGAALLVFSRERNNVRRIGAVQASSEELTARAISGAVTHGTCGFVWAADQNTFHIWCREQAGIEITRDALVRAGSSTPTSAITAVVSIEETGPGTRRGVTVRTPSLKPIRLVLVQDDDVGERTWTIQLARELAGWLRVPYIDRGEASDRWT
jgi:hypothetical protein